MLKGKSIKYIDVLLEEIDEDANASDINCIVKQIDSNIMALKNNVETLANNLHNSEDYKNKFQKILYDLSVLKNDLVEEYNKLDEMMATGTVAGGMEYSTPAAFSKTNKTSNKIKKISTMFGMQPVAKTNRWFKKLDKNTGKPINENTEIKLNTSLYTRMMKTINGDI